MAQNEYDLDDDFEDYDDNAISQVRKAHKAATKRIKELEAELGTLRVESRKRSVGDVLTSRGFNPKIADLIPSDLTSEDEIKAWLDDRADVFQPANSGGAGSDNTANEQSNGVQVELPPELARFNDVVSTGQAPTGDENQMLAMIQAAKTPEDLNRLLFGNAAGPPAY